jgi:hypothetical protein
MLSANATDTSFAALNPTVVKPVPSPAAGVYDIGLDSSNIPPSIKLMLVGVGSDNDAFSIRIQGWERVVTPDANAVDLWVPTILAELGCILGAKTGATGGIVPATERFADTITVIAARQSVVYGLNASDVVSRGSVVVFSPTNDLIAYAIVPTFGCPLIQFQFDDTTNTPTMNGVWSLYGAT